MFPKCSFACWWQSVTKFLQIFNEIKEIRETQHAFYSQMYSVERVALDRDLVFPILESVQNNFSSMWRYLCWWSSHFAFYWSYLAAATPAARSLQSCLTLCDPTDGSPPGSPVPGILQARTLEWVAISFSNLPCKVQNCSPFYPLPHLCGWPSPPFSAT